MDRRIVLAQQRVAGNDADGGTMGLGQISGDGLDLDRAHIIGGRIDHVLGQGAGVGNGTGLGHIDTLCRDQPRLGPRLARFVAREPIETERPGQGNGGRTVACGGRGDLILALGQFRR